MPKLAPLPPPPTASTLAKYGLTAADWAEMCRRQRGLCPVCQRPFGDRKLAIDHAHVQGFKAHKTRRRNGRTFKVRAMSPVERRLHVRGILHSWCNRFLRNWMTLKRASAMVEYLKAYEDRKAKSAVG